MRDRPMLLGSLIVVTAASGFGMLGVLARFAYAAGFAPLTFVAWRAFFGAAVVAVVIGVGLRRGRSIVNPLRLPASDAVALFVVAFSGFALNLALFVAFNLTSVALVLLAFYTYPALVAIVAVALGHERLDGTRWAALLLAVAGMTLVVGGGLVGGSSSVVIAPLGLGLAFVGALWQTVFVTVMRDRFTAVPSDQAAIWTLVFTSAACAVLATLVGDPLDVPFREPRALGLAAFTGIVAAGIPSVLFLTGIRAIGGTRAGILMLVEPLVGVLLAGLLLGETLQPIQLVGAAAILAAGILLQRGGQAVGGGIEAAVAESEFAESERMAPGTVVPEPTAVASSERR